MEEGRQENSVVVLTRGGPAGILKHRNYDG